MKKIAAAVLVGGLLLSACAEQQAPIKTTTPTPWPGDAPASPTPTPSPSAEPPPDPEVSARQVYLAATDEIDRLLHSGGADELTPRLVETTAGQHRQTVLALLRQAKSSGYRADGKSVMHIARTERAGTDLVIVHACEDASGVTLRNGAGSPLPVAEKYFYTRAEVARADGTWKVARARSDRLRNFSDSAECRHVA